GGGGALLLPLPARAARSSARLAAALDATGVRRRQAPERGGDVVGGLPVVLARTPGRAADVRARYRRRRGRDTGDGLPRLPDVGGACVSRLPLRRRGDRARRRATVARGAGHVRAGDRDARAVPGAPARVPRGRGRLRAWPLQTASGASHGYESVT